MWESIANHISHEIGHTFEITTREQILGGDVNQAYLLSNGRLRYFVKINDKDAITNFTAEAESLQRLKTSNTIKIPDVIVCGTTKKNAFLVLEFIHVSALIDRFQSYQAGKQLAELHRWDVQKEFGFDQDNYIGFNIQPNSWNKNWARFFSEQRIGWQLQLLHDKGISFVNIDTFVDWIYEKLAHHKPRPSLLHGDLWTGNLGETTQGPLFYDPASYWGDRECDIAMSMLFGLFPKTFYQGYNDVNPLPQDYSKRIPIYNLYHTLNHCNCFGGHYLSQAELMVKNLMNEQ